MDRYTIADYVMENPKNVERVREELERLSKLQIDEHYYGEYGRQWLSNSDIITLLNDPKSFRVPKEPTKAMLLGRYFHTAMLEPDKVNSVEFKSVDASSRNTKKYKDALNENGRMLMMLAKKKKKLIVL